MSKITNRLAYFAKIKQRSDDLKVYVAKASGKTDMSGTISPDGIDRQDFPERRQPYATERYSAEISNSVNFLNPAMQNIVTDEHVKVRAQKVAAGHLGGESKWFINEVMVENHYVRGYSLMIGGWTGKGSVTRKVQVEGSWVTNDGPYEYGTEVQVEFVPNAGYRFVSWSDGGQNPHTVTMNDDVILEVVAEQVPVYTLAFSAAGVGTVAATVNETAVLSPAQVEEGASVAITATASAGHLFSEWIGYPEGAVISGNIVSFAMPSSAVSITANFIEAPAFQGLKLTNTAVSEYITAVIDETEVQLNFYMDGGSGYAHRYAWSSADESVTGATNSRTPSGGDAIYVAPVEEAPQIGTVSSYVAPTPISNVLHFKAGTDTGFQSLQYSTDGGTWTNWPEVAGDLNVMIIDANDGTNDLVIAFDGYNEVLSWYTWTIYPVGGGDESSWHSATRNVAVGDVLEFVSGTAASANVTVTGLHYTNSFTIVPDSEYPEIPIYSFNSPVSFNDGTIHWFSTDGEDDYVEASPDPGSMISVQYYYDRGSESFGVMLTSITPVSYVTCAAYPDTKCYFLDGMSGMYIWADGTTMETATMLIMSSSRYPSVDDLCQYLLQGSETPVASTIASFVIVPPADYGTVTFSDDLYLKGVSDTWYGKNSVNRFYTDGTVNVSGRPSSVITGNDGPADFSQTNNYELGYLFGNFYDDGYFFKVVDASGLDLSQITLGEGTFDSMFSTGYWLTAAPALPATTLTNYCYEYMFQSCIALTSAPSLPAPTLTDCCYSGMFTGCSNLNSITCLATDISASGCTDGWLSDVADEGIFTWTTTPGATWPGWTTGESGIPEGWTVNPEPPFQGLKFTNVPGTVYITVDDSNYGYFSSQSTESVTAWCSAGTIIYTQSRNPEAGATVYSDPECSTSAGTISLVDNPEINKLILDPQGSSISSLKYSLDNGDTFQDWNDPYPDIEFSNSICLKSTNDVWGASLSTAGLVKASGRLTSLLDGSGASPMSLTDANEHAFDSLFEYVNVIDASGLILDSPELSTACYQELFKDNYFIQFAPDITATNLASSCCANMYEYCFNLTDSGTLSANVLEDYCYYRMFRECHNLSSITCLATDINASNCTKNWVQNVADSGTFHRNPDVWAGWSIGDTSGIPSGWTIDPDLNYLTFEVLSMEIGETDNLVLGTHGSPSQYTIEYSKNGGPWTEYTHGTPQTAERILVTTGDKIRFRNTGDTSGLSESSTNYYQFGRTSTYGARFKVSGDVTTLLKATGNVESISDYCFYCLFNNFSRIADMSELILPSTSLAPHCYQGMFKQASLDGYGFTTAVPALPFEGFLPESCYASMFQSCRSIKGPVYINAYSPYSSGTTSACTNMFYGSGTEEGAGGTIHYTPMGGTTAQDWINAANIDTTYWTVVG